MTDNTLKYKYDNLEVQFFEQIERNKKLEEKYEQLAEQLVGDDPTDRYSHQELIDEVNRIKDNDMDNFNTSKINEVREMIKQIDEDLVSLIISKLEELESDVKYIKDKI